VAHFSWGAPPIFLSREFEDVAFEDAVCHDLTVDFEPLTPLLLAEKK
jgi:hypothetical protein